MAEPHRAHHFATLDQQVLAARLGMWVFMGSETLLFAALFGLYASYRAEYPAAFSEGMTHMAHGLGALNTLILLTSSLLAALGLDALERGQRRAAVLLIFGTAALGVTFLAVKGFEYAEHVREGMVFGGRGEFFVRHTAPGLPVFVTLYFLMTGLHALHVTAGVLILVWLGSSVRRGRISEAAPHPLELGVLYWHLVDTLWVFLWPMFYFAGRSHAMTLTARRRFAANWLALVGLAGLSFGLSKRTLSSWSMPAAMAIAGCKALLIVFFFMHVSHYRVSVRLAGVAAVALILLLASFMAADVLTRTG